MIEIPSALPTRFLEIPQACRAPFFHHFFLSDLCASTSKSPTVNDEIAPAPRPTESRPHGLNISGAGFAGMSGWEGSAFQVPGVPAGTLDIVVNRSYSFGCGSGAVNHGRKWHDLAQMPGIF